MGATLEPIQSYNAYILRTGSKHNQHGDSYSFSAVVELEGNTAEIKGGTGAFRETEAVKEVLRPLGIEQVIYDRVIDGITVRHILKIK